MFEESTEEVIVNAQRTTKEAFEQTIAAIPTCALDEQGIRDQRTRYARLAPSVTQLEREPEAVNVEFAEEFDRATLEQALAVERQCCPFFQFRFDEAKRRLRITVRDAAQLPALDAMSHVLGAAHTAPED
jgi:hypothetical protein